jgi:hypothetical protein
MSEEKAIIEKEIGGDGASAGLYVDDSHLSIQVRYPIAKVVEPIAKIADKAIDKLDEWIPGDQKAIADKLKAEIREEIAELLAKEMKEA